MTAMRLGRWMIRTIAKPVRWKRLLLMAAVVALARGYLATFRVLPPRLPRIDCRSIIAAAIVSFLLAAVLYRTARLFLGNTRRHWYASPLGILWLVVGLTIGIHLVRRMAPLSRILPWKVSIHHDQFVFATIGLTLLWMLLIDRPQRPSLPRPRLPPRKFPPRQYRKKRKPSKYRKEIT